ncbi:hypothetical protein KSP40_PGU018916 [Platanthera guangdongensis]|uniref:Uncharacterized protein n=1 Tax=Platanthera guangdongensis TaxID=2320717 RepID=A0ABR2LCH6_9ASPA
MLPPTASPILSDPVPSGHIFWMVPPLLVEAPTFATCYLELFWREVKMQDGSTSLATFELEGKLDLEEGNFGFENEKHFRLCLGNRWTSIQVANRASLVANVGPPLRWTMKPHQKSCPFALEEEHYRSLTHCFGYLHLPPKKTKEDATSKTSVDSETLISYNFMGLRNTDYAADPHVIANQFKRGLDGFDDVDVELKL